MDKSNFHRCMPNLSNDIHCTNCRSVVFPLFPIKLYARIISFDVHCIVSLCYNFMVTHRVATQLPITQSLTTDYKHNIFFSLSLSWFKTRLPYNWKQPIPYIVTMCMESIGFICACIVFVAILFMFIGICSFLITFISDMEDEIHALNDKIEIEPNIYLTPAHYCAIKRKLFDIIQFHLDATQFSALSIASILNLLLSVHGNLNAIHVWIFYFFFFLSLLLLQICVSIFKRLQ